MKIEIDKQSRDFYANLSNKELEHMLNRFKKQYNRFEYKYKYSYLNYLIFVIGEISLAKEEKRRRENRINKIKNKRSRRFI